MIALNTIYNEDNIITMSKIDDCMVDLTVTSPPYDNLRDYKGFSFDVKEVSGELYRITKIGGVVVWVVGDAVINGSETGTSFKQALCFIDIGFHLHDTMIYLKDSIAFPDSNRYSQAFEYMFVFSKGKPKTFNCIRDRKNKWAGHTVRGHERLPSGEIRYKADKGVLKEFSSRFNVWEYGTGSFKSSKDLEARNHPAIFPEKLAQDHIISWSNEGDLVYDPFGGSGTVAKMSHILKRNWILSEISNEYCEVSRKRISPYLQQLTIL